MSVRVMGRVFEGAEGVTGNDRVVLLVLADHAHDDGAGAYPSQERIAAKAGGISERAVRDCLGRLERGGHIRRLRKRGRQVEYGIAATLAGISEEPTRQVPADIPADSRKETGGRPPLNRQEPSREPSTPPKSPNGGARSSEVDAIVERTYALWLRETGREPGTHKLTAGRARVIRARLREGYTERDIATAIRKVARSRFHRGDNDRRQRYDDLTLICRNGERLEGYRDMPSRVPRGADGEERELDEFYDRWLERRGRQHTLDPRSLKLAQASVERRREVAGNGAAEHRDNQRQREEAQA